MNQLHWQSFHQMWVVLSVLSLFGVHGWFMFGHPIKGVIHVITGLSVISAYALIYGFGT